MDGFILEALAGRSWKRDGRTFWTLADAKREALRILRRGKAVQVRVLPVEVQSAAIETFSATEVRPNV